MKKVLYILGELSDLDVDWLVANGRRERIPKNKVLIQEGTPIQALHIVLEGRFKVSIVGNNDLELARLGGGEILGEMSFIDARPPSATATAIEDSLVLTVHRRSLEEKLKLDTGFAARFYRAVATFLSDRLRMTVGRLGYGAASQDDGDAQDELDPNVLDGVSRAGARFDRMLKRLIG